jgi:thiol:disulfide interchange protein
MLALASETRAPGTLFRIVTAGSVAFAITACHPARLENLRTPTSNNAVRFDAPPSYPDIVWINSIDEARARAADEHKPLIIFVRAAWSKASVDMESTIWRDDRVLALATSFVALRVDLTPSPEGIVPDSLAPFDIRGVPTTIIVSARGKILGRFGKGMARPADVAESMRLANDSISK